MERELLFSVTRKDLRIEYYRGTGNGGQKRNKTSSACRITHVESGAVGTAQEHRSQSMNREAAFLRMFHDKRFQIWYKKKCGQWVLTEAEIQAEVVRLMAPQNLLIEIRDNGRWVKL